MHLRSIIEDIFAEYDIEIKIQNERCILYVCPFHDGQGSDHNSVVYVDNGFWKCMNPCCFLRGRMVKFVQLITKSSWREAKEICKKRFEYDTEEEAFLDDDYVVRSYRNYPSPNFKEDVCVDNNYLKEHDFKWSTFELLDIGKIKNKEAFVVPYYQNGIHLGYAVKPYEGRANYPKSFPSHKYLYGYDYAKNFDYVYIVEGHRDVWRLVQFGLPAVGLSTASMSDEQMTLILKTWNKVILCLDGDKAGRAGAEKIKGKLEGLMCVESKDLPDGLDPENYREVKRFLEC